MMEGLLTDAEINLGRKSMETALDAGASAARVSLNKSLTDLAGSLDGELDKVTHSLDRSLGVSLFVDGRFGTFSTNRLSEEGLDSFIREAVETVRMMAPDPCRFLPSSERTAKDALTGTELDLLDTGAVDNEGRIGRILGASIFRSLPQNDGFKVVSEEIEYSENIYDQVLMDSSGLFARHSESSFDIGCQITIETPSGDRYSSYWWDSAPKKADLLPSIPVCSARALAKAVDQIGSKHRDGGRFNMVVDTECASRLVSPLLSALSGYAIQQKNSFLDGKTGEKVFPESLTITDLPHVKGRSGSKLFDSEGVATKEWTIIDKGVVKGYFINTYIAAKTGMTPNVDDAVKPRLMPWGGCITRDDVLRKMGSGILVTGFNGGNSNSATGDFSYGIEGFLFEDGKIGEPVREMLITGNLVSLWNNFAAAAEDSRPCFTKIIPTIAFKDVDFR